MPLVLEHPMMFTEVSLDYSVLGSSSNSKKGQWLGREKVDKDLTMTTSFLTDPCRSRFDSLVICQTDRRHSRYESTLLTIAQLLMGNG